MAETVVGILNRARDILIDENVTRWGNGELLRWFHDALKALVSMRPDANPVHEIHTTVVGARQTLLPQDLGLIDVIRQIGGSALQPINRSVFDVHKPGWMNEPPSPTVSYWHWDSRKPREFYLLPVPTSGIQIEITVSRVPDLPNVINFETSTIETPVSDVFSPALVDYVLYRAFSKDTSEGSQGRAASHYAQFQNALSKEAAARQSASPAG